MVHTPELVFVIEGAHAAALCAVQYPFVSLSLLIISASINIVIIGIVIGRLLNRRVNVPLEDFR